MLGVCLKKDAGTRAVEKSVGVLVVVGGAAAAAGRRCCGLVSSGGR
jgi:hypothetical protein